jgi:ribosome-binding protein aMBF1 (putative translation factor)
MNLVLKIAILQKFSAQADFAKQIDLNETVLSRIVRERRVATPEQQKKMSRILEIPEEELFPSKVEASQ